MRYSRRIAGFITGIFAGLFLLLGILAPAGVRIPGWWGATIVHASAALVQTANNTTGGGGGTSVNATFGTTPTQGDLLVAAIGANGNTTITALAGWSTAFNQAGTVSQAIFYKIAGAGEPTNISVNVGTSLGLGLQIYEYSGISGTPLDATSTASGTGTSVGGASLVTSQPAELIFAAGTVAGQTSFSGWSNSFNSENNFSNGSGNPRTRGTYGGADLIVNATGTYSTVGTVGASGAWIEQTASFRVSYGYAQAAYRWFVNTNSTSVGSPLAAQNGPMTQTSPGTPFRLRMLIGVDGSQLALSGDSLKLQYVNEGTGTCAAPSGAGSYADVTTSTGPIHFYDNAAVADGVPLAPTSTDPVDGTNTIVNQTYEEVNPFTNSQGAIPVGEDGKWDFALVDNNASSSATYCFRAVQSDGTPFDTYSVYPAFSIGNIPPTVSGAILNGGNDITLIAGTTATIDATATVTDLNGYTDIATVTAMFYQTSFGENCTPDDNDCYQVPSCTLSSCFGTSCTATCSANIQYFADPTDAGTPWAGDSWTAWMQVTDHSNATSTATSSPVSLLSLLGLQVATSVINFGSLTAGQSAATLTIPTTILSAGNVSLNATLYGTNLTNGTNSISMGNEHYATSSIAYALGTSLLPSPGATVTLDMPKTIVNGFPATSTIYWGISAPSPPLRTGGYTGQNTFVGVRNSLPWP